MLDRFFDRKDPYNKVIDVTPAIADEWLSTCNSHNRKLVEAHVERLAGEMKAGRWRLTHQGIANPNQPTRRRKPWKLRFLKPSKPKTC
jgi:hypothetical protein